MSATELRILRTLVRAGGCQSTSALVEAVADDRADAGTVAEALDDLRTRSLVATCDADSFITPEGDIEFLAATGRI